MVNLENIDITDTHLSADQIASKYDPICNIDCMSIRGYVCSMEALIDSIDRLNSFGVDNSTEDTLSLTNTCSIDKRFMIDVVKNLVVRHTADMIPYLVDFCKLIKETNDD